MQIKHILKSASIQKNIIHVCLSVYTFLIVFPHTTSLREIALWTALAFWLIKRSNRPAPFLLLNPITISLGLFMSVALLSSVLGLDPLENLKRFKGELLTLLILFCVIATEYESFSEIKRLILSPVIAFTVYTLFMLIESRHYGLIYFWDKSNRGFSLLDGYGQMAITIIPITLGMSLLMKRNVHKFAFLFVAIIEFLIIVPYSFTTVVSVSSAFLIYMFFASPKKNRLWMSGFVASVLIAAVLTLNILGDHPAVTEFNRKLQKAANPIAEFKSENGFTDRIRLWDAAVDIIENRPLLGYGWGIKQYPRIIQEEKLMDKWKVEKPNIYEFYILKKDKFFPFHNMFLEIAIQTGIIGAALFLLFLLIYIKNLIKGIRLKTSERDSNFAIILTGGTLLSFMIMNIMNNELCNISGEIMFVVLGAGAAWMRMPHENLKLNNL